MDKVNLLVLFGLVLIYISFRFFICFFVFLLILISVMGYKAGVIIVVKFIVLILLLGLIKIKKILIVKYFL